ncbi:hypothetical protein Skr01_61490 [Sphaerisporangium krabiense]|uniref:Lipoprotein n=1 Tax=Sphaerisporangium krabiense TaxID=763782 RepID=A0A7W9DPB8_9ACTN|nr:hypothetical protein [Sphaerisporangium krabiense]MBB5626272.1 hypothetical protein [Sphaerisporangium krabiense]GII66064.1 hypothetical protein Skr01_61490 [Sphaerisporangium krabiense]
MRRAVLVVGVVGMGLVAALTGCASGQEAGVASAADRFVAAVRGGQGEAACALLAPDTAEAVASDEETGCAAAILKADLPEGKAGSSGGSAEPSEGAPSAGADGAAQVWGREAQVRVAGDTLFLHRFSKGWLVRAAGCTSQGEKPYRCKVEG